MTEEGLKRANALYTEVQKTRMYLYYWNLGYPIRLSCSESEISIASNEYGAEIIIGMLQQRLDQLEKELESI